MQPTEWLVGGIGLLEYFGNSPVQLKSSVVRRALKGDEYIQTRAKAWASSKKPEKLPKLPFNVGDYDQLVTALHLPQIAQPDISRVDDQYSMDIVCHFMDIAAYLAEKEPALKISRGFIAREIEPPDSDKARFVWACNILDDVTLIFDLLDAGALTVVESDVFRTLYPEIAFATAKAYMLAAISYIYDEQKPTIASWQSVGLSALMGVPVSDFNDVMTWQAGYSPTKGPGRPPSQAPDLAGQSATDSQRKDFPR